MQDLKLPIREALRELEILDQIRDQRRRHQGINYYTPNPAQLKAHQSRAQVILFCGGNRSGKSTFGAAELALHLTRKYPDWYPKERRFNRPIKAVVNGTRNDTIEKVLEPKIKQYLPTDHVLRWKRVSQSYLSRIYCKDGSTVDILTNEMSDMAFESADWDFWWGDEPQEERKYQAIMRGLTDRMGRGVVTFTPLIEPWMKEKLVDRADGKFVEAFTADIRDNKFDVKGTPILSEESIQRFEAALPEDVRETRIHGKFFHLRGLVYTEFSDIHERIFDYTYPDPVICVLDPHDRQPHFAIWAVVDRTNDLFVHSELAVTGTVNELARAIKAHESRMGYRLRKRIIDPNFGRKPLITTGRTVIQELAHAGCSGWFEADDAKDEGRLKVKDYLHYDRTKPIDLNNKPKLYFHKENCPKTIRSIKNHQYEDWIGHEHQDRDPKEKAKDKDTHGADDVRYLCMSNPRFDRILEREYELEGVPY